MRHAPNVCYAALHHLGRRRGLAFISSLSLYVYAVTMPLAKRRMYLHSCCIWRGNCVS